MSEIFVTYLLESFTATLTKSFDASTFKIFVACLLESSVASLLETFVASLSEHFCRFFVKKNFFLSFNLGFGFGLCYRSMSLPPLVCAFGRIIFVNFIGNFSALLKRIQLITNATMTLITHWRNQSQRQVITSFLLFIFVFLLCSHFWRPFKQCSLQIRGAP